MKSYKDLLNSLSDDRSLRVLNDDEIKKLRDILLCTLSDLQECCRRNHLKVMLIGGTALGAVRHHGFIPWDDDLDVAMTRKDFEKLKRIFDRELGEKYILSAPNYNGTAKNRFPQILIRNTQLIEAGADLSSDLNLIKVDIFLIENVPENKIYRYLKGTICSALMLIASYADTYQHRSEASEAYMCKTPEGKKEYKKRMFFGRLFSFWGVQKWYDLVDRFCQYRRKSSLAGIPSGRKHYFGEIRPRKTFLPMSKGNFEGLTVGLPADPDDYLNNLYGSDYMEMPPVEKREKHFIYSIEFDVQEKML